MSPEQHIFIDRLYHQHFYALRGQAFHYMHSWDKAEVAVQEAFCIAVEKVDDLIASEDPLRWLRATVKNTARNMKKHERYQKALFLYLDSLPSEPAVPAGLEGIDIYELCEQIAGKENFRLFERIVLEGVSYLDAAKELGIGVWACRKRVQRTSEKLQDGLKKYFG